MFNGCLIFQCTWEIGMEFLIQNIDQISALNVRRECRSMIQAIRTRLRTPRKESASRSKSVQAEVIKQP